MRHRILTCKNHPELRWGCKDIAWTEAHGDKPAFYNGQRSIFFLGTPSGKGMYQDGSGVSCTTAVELPGGKIQIIDECACSTKDLILAEEDKLVVTR